VTPFQGGQDERVGDAEHDDGQARQGRGALGSHLRGEPDAQSPGGQQARDGAGPVDREAAAMPQLRGQHERGAEDERSAVHRRKRQELMEVTGQQGIDGGLGLDAPIRGEAEEAESGDDDESDGCDAAIAQVAASHGRVDLSQALAHLHCNHRPRGTFA
jgi:hypothetical protein